jgi:hypothetical protein
MKGENQGGCRRKIVKVWTSVRQCDAKCRSWKEAGPELEAIRRREIQDPDNLKVLAMLEGGFNRATRTLPPRT